MSPRRKVTSMIRSVFPLVVSAAVLGALGCHASTQAKFVIPPNSQLVVNGDPVKVADDGKATMSAFGWGGASYKITRNGNTLSEGKLDTKFRPISLIWPPFGALYVPKGLLGEKTYDLTESANNNAKKQAHSK